MKQLKIRDLTMRDGQQSLFATRMSQSMVDALLPYYTQAGFYAIEVWGGAVPDSVMRYLDESPWDRLRKIDAKMHGISHLTALSRGRNLFGYAPYPSSVIEGFYDEAIKSGLNIMRIFDALNDLDNVKESVETINRMGGIADGAVCYTVDPKDEKPVEKPGFFARLFGKAPAEPEKIFSDDYFVEKAQGYAKLGAKIITLKDMAGLVNPARIATLIPKMKAAATAINPDILIDFHTHCTPGYGLASGVMAILHGVDILDTNIWYFGEGSAAPAIELIYVFAKKLGVEIGADMKAVAEIRTRLKDVRLEFKANGLDKYELPKAFDPLTDTLPANIDKLFDEAIAAAKANNEPALLDACHAIEAYFGFPKPNEIVKHAEVPGGMYTNMLAQLKQLKAEDVLDDAMRLIPKVRRDAGLVPLVTPTSQIVGSQAVILAMDRKAGRPDYSHKSNEFTALVRGEYGKTPVAVDPAFREQITGSATEYNYDVSKYVAPENPTLAEFGGVKLATNNDEKLLLELLPRVAKDFLTKRRKEEFAAKAPAAPAKEEAPAPKAEEAAAPKDAPVTGPCLKAPMGGVVVEIKVKPGDKVTAGQAVIVYEAMKMQNEIEADASGVVKRVLVAPGQTISGGDALIEFEDEKAVEEAPVVAAKCVTAPMGGVITEVMVKVGDKVSMGQPIVTYEAMKMQNEIESDRSGTVKRILVEAGQTISGGDALIEFA